MKIVFEVKVSKLGKHRSRLQIVWDVLSVIGNNNRVRKTQIMYKAYLSYKLLNKYLSDVLSAGLVVCDNKNCFQLTLKGERFLERFGEYHQSRKVVKERLDSVENQRMELEEMCQESEVISVRSRSQKTAFK